MRWFVAGLSAFVAVVVFMFVGHRQNDRVSGIVLDFGRVRKGDRLTRPVSHRNRTGSTLEVRRILSTCTCAAALASKTPIAPGESLHLDVNMDTRDMSGEVDREIQVLFEQDTAPPVTIHVRAFVFSDQPDLSCGSIDFGRCIRGTPETREVAILNSPSSDSDWRIAGVEVSGESIQARYNREEGKIVCVLPATSASGAVDDKVRVHVNSGEGIHVLELPVTGIVVDRLHLKPSKVDAGVCSPGQNVVISSWLYGQCDADTLGQANDSMIRCSKEDPAGDRPRKVVFSLVAPTIPGTFAKPILLKTGEADCPEVTLTVSGMVAPRHDPTED